MFYEFFKGQLISIFTEDIFLAFGPQKYIWIIGNFSLKYQATDNLFYYKLNTVLSSLKRFRLKW